MVNESLMKLNSVLEILISFIQIQRLVKKTAYLTGWSRILINFNTRINKKTDIFPCKTHQNDEMSRFVILKFARSKQRGRRTLGVAKNVILNRKRKNVRLPTKYIKNTKIWLWSNLIVMNKNRIDFKYGH